MEIYKNLDLQDLDGEIRKEIDGRRIINNVTFR